MRLVFCNSCQTLEEVPDYEGTDPVDPLIEQIVLRHNERDPMAHGGRNLTASPMRIVHIEPNKALGLTSEQVWAKDRDEILKRLREENKKVGFDAWAYEAVNTYQEDALKCYNAHRRPSLADGKPCIDFWSDSKRIGRPTKEGQAVIKENFKLGTNDPHICQFCPYSSGVTTEIRFKKGMYK